MPALRQLFLAASLLHFCTAAPVIINPGAVNELSWKKPFDTDNGFVPESGVLADRVAIDVGDAAYQFLHHPANPSVIITEAFRLALSTLQNSIAYGVNTASQPINIGNIF
ncbi:hypothetical protein TWF481_006477 [Arthrobotrys musiformis]|uniref:Uncharacterized protein n=1 Tax=Arthrobotrys musiformis TaxID=47236 RepID=A0AAV9WAK0_9PEZI